MRKRRSKSIKGFTLMRMFAILIFILICIFIGTGYSLLTEKIEITGKSTMLSEEIKKEDVTEQSNSIVRIEHESSDETTYIFSLVIDNKDKDYYQWIISFDVSDTPNEVMVCDKEEGILVETSENTITVKKDVNANWSLNSTNKIQFRVVFNKKISPLIISNIIVNGKKIDSFTSDSDKIIDGNSIKKYRKKVNNKNENTVSNNVNNEKNITNEENAKSN